LQLPGAPRLRRTGATAATDGAPGARDEQGKRRDVGEEAWNDQQKRARADQRPIHDRTARGAAGG
jgi:hypothetical protein